MFGLPVPLIRDDTIIAGRRACGVGEGEETVVRDVVEGGIGEIAEPVFEVVGIFDLVAFAGDAIPGEGRGGSPIVSENGNGCNKVCRVVGIDSIVGDEEEVITVSRHEWGRDLPLKTDVTKIDVGWVGGGGEGGVFEKREAGE